MSQHIESVHLAVPDADLKDLHERLSRVRWPAGRAVTDTGQGPTRRSSSPHQLLARQLRLAKRCEAELNGWGLHRTTIDGLDIDFLHIRSPEPNATPLVMTHGWPGSVLEFRKVIGPLTDPAAHGGDPRQAFHLVIPVLPGFGFSAKPHETGWTLPRIAHAWITLMGRLGYERWGAQGGDLGCAVTDEIAKRTAGRPDRHPPELRDVPPDPRRGRRTPPRRNGKRCSAKYFWDNLSGYAKEQSTRPQTIGYSLADSPVGPGGLDLRHVPGHLRHPRRRRRRASPSTRCSTTSCSTGCPTPAPPPPGCTGK